MTKKKLYKVECLSCKGEIITTERTYRRLNMTLGLYGRLCDDCTRTFKKQAKEILETQPKWEGVTVNCDLDLAKHLEKTMKEFGE